MSTEETMALKTTIDLSPFRVDPENRVTDTPNSLTIETMISNGNLDEVPQYIKDLAASIKATDNKNEQAIQVLPKSADGYYVAVSGNTRLLALKYLNAIGETVTLKYETRSDLLDVSKRLASRFIENHARTDVTAVQKAYEIGKLRELLSEQITSEKPDLKPRQVAGEVSNRLGQLTGLHKATLGVYLNFGEFPEVLKSYVIEGKIDLYAAYAVFAATKESPDSITADLTALYAIAVANGKNLISQGMVKSYYSDREKSQEDTKKLRSAIERSSAALQVKAEDGEIDPDTLALAQIESESTGIPTEKILDNVQSDPEAPASESSVKATAEKLKNRQEMPVLARPAADSKINLNLESLQQIKLSAYDAEGLQQIQNRVAGLLKSVASLVATDEQFISSMIDLLASTLPASDESASTLAGIYDRAFEGINGVKSEAEKQADEVAKQERIAKKEAEKQAKEKAKAEAANTVKPTESKAKKGKKKSVAEAVAEEEANHNG